MNHGNWQFKFFAYWFAIFFSAFFVAIGTGHEIAINIVLFLLMSIGAVMLATTGKDAAQSISSKNWPTTEFTILNTGVNFHSSTEGGAGCRKQKCLR